MLLRLLRCVYSFTGSYLKPALLCGLTKLVCHNKALGSFGVAVGDLNLVTVVPAVLYMYL